MLSLRTDLTAVGAVMMALAAYPFLPALAWVVPFLLLAFYLGLRFGALAPPERRWVGLCCAAAALFQLASFAAHHTYDPRQATTWLDDQNYFVNAIHIAEAWRSGFFPELSRKGSPPYLGTLHTGYERVLAAVFYVTGPEFRAGLALNLLGVAFLPLIAFLLTETLFRDLSAPGEAGTGGALYSRLRLTNPPRAAACIATLHPSVYYWGSQLLKDTLLAVLFLCTLLCLLDALRTRRLFPAMLFVLLLWWTAIFRAYAALSLAAALFLYPFATLRRGALAWGLVYAAIAVVLLSYTPTFGSRMDQLIHSFAAVIPRELISFEAAVTHFGSALPRMMLAPYAWVRAEGPAPLYELYPGMWYLYLLVYPLAAAGMLRALRLDHRMSLIPIMALIASGFVLLTAYGGNAPRQRLYLELTVLAYAGLGVRSRHKPAALVLVWGVVFLFAAAQLLRLYMRR